MISEQGLEDVWWGECWGHSHEKLASAKGLRQGNAQHI